MVIFWEETNEVHLFGKKSSLVRMEGLEPSRIAPCASETHAYTSSATSAWRPPLPESLFRFYVPIHDVGETVGRDHDTLDSWMLHFFGECIAVG